MVTNFDIIIKKYPEVVKECLSIDARIAVDKNTGEVKCCNDVSDCDDCIFSGAYDGVRCSGDKIKTWLSKEVKVAVEVKEFDLIDNSNNTRNSNGEITW